LYSKWSTLINTNNKIITWTTLVIIISSFLICHHVLYIICVFNYLKYGCTPNWSTHINTNNFAAWITFLFILACSNKQYCVIISNIFMFQVIWLYSKLEYTYQYKKITLHELLCDLQFQVFWLAIPSYTSFVYLTIQNMAVLHLGVHL